MIGLDLTFVMSDIQAHSNVPEFSYYSIHFQFIEDDLGLADWLHPTANGAWDPFEELDRAFETTKFMVEFGTDLKDNEI